MNIKRYKCDCIYWLIIFVFMALIFSSIGYAEEQKNPLSYDSDTSGTMLIIPLDNSAIVAAKDFVQQIQTSNIVKISAMVFAPPGIAPKLVLSGDQADLQQALELYQKLLPEKTNSPLVVIAASLRELTKSNTHNVGINPIPNVGITSIANRGRTDDNSFIKNNIQTLTGTWTDMLALNDALNNSKVLVSSEVYTPNGVKAQISNVKSVPAFSVDTNGNVQTQYQNLETSIAVVPTIIKYNADKPEESLIRVDVDVKVSIISGNMTFKHVYAPEYSVKTMTTTRVLTADNQTNVIGSFITDSDIVISSGIPILGKLPLMKYLFSQKHTEKERNTAVLTISVRLLPALSSQN